MTTTPTTMKSEFCLSTDCQCIYIQTQKWACREARDPHEPMNLLNEFNNSEEPELCSICWEEMGDKKNKCSTTCGHEFHLDCILNTYDVNNSCPLCREPLNKTDFKLAVAIVEEDDYEDEEEEEEEEEVIVDDIEETDEQIIARFHEPHGASPELIAERLLQQGYTVSDLIMLMLQRTSSKPEYKIAKNISNMETSYYKIIDEMDLEFDEIQTMGKEDVNIENPVVINVIIDVVI